MLCYLTCQMVKIKSKLEIIICLTFLHITMLVNSYRDNSKYSKIINCENIIQRQIEVGRKRTGRQNIHRSAKSKQSINSGQTGILKLSCSIMPGSTFQTFSILPILSAVVLTRYSLQNLDSLSGTQVSNIFNSFQKYEG